MVKSYAAELLLKNKGFIDGLNQAVKKTKELKKELEKTMIVEAKLGSSFKNIKSRISKIAPTKKTIKIEATENVTKTMNNVNRSIFEMSNKMNSTINSTMKGFRTRLSASLPKIQAIGNTMAAVANGSKVLSSMAGAYTMAGTGAYTMAGTGAGIAGAALLKGKGNNKSNNKFSSLKEVEEWYSKTYEPTGVLQSLTSGFKNAFDSSVGTKLDNKELKVKGKITFNEDETTKEFENVAQRFSN